MPRKRSTMLSTLALSGGVADEADVGAAEGGEFGGLLAEPSWRSSSGRLASCGGGRPSLEP